MGFEMRPVIKPRPIAEPYSTEYLELYGRWNREKFKLKYGQPAPGFDTNSQIKRWADTGANPNVSYTFLVLDKKTLELVPMTISGEQARTLNLPGVYEYPSWKPAPSRVRILIVRTGATVPGDVTENLATKEQAEALAPEVTAAFGLEPSAVGVVENTLNDAFLYVYPADDQRRVYMIVADLVGGFTRTFLAGRLLLEKYRAGVGAPGHWAAVGRDETASLTWASEIGPTLNWNDLPEIPIPMRSLYADEELFPQFGGNVGVRRKSPAPATGGGFQQADRDVLKAIAVKVGV